MKKGSKILIILMSTILLMSVIVGIATRKSYSNNLDLGRRMQQADSLSFLDNSDFVKTYFDNNINDLSQLKEKSDVIIRVRATGDRQMMSQTILSKVESLNVYKGLNIKKGDIIYIYEPNYFINNSYMAMYGYNLMVNNNEYVFFLKKLQVPNGYRYKGEEKISYMFDVEDRLGKPLSKEVNILLAHIPDHFNKYTDWGADVIFSGDKHGGIIRLPFIGGLVSSGGIFFPEYDGGVYESDNSTMVVSRGLGNYLINIRVFNRPEIVVVTLKVR